MSEPEIGAVVGGMRIDAVAGRGGMGTVYRAHEVELNRAVALKIVNAEFAAQPEFRERFRREARLAAALDHPHVVPVYRAGEADGHLFIAMRFVEGTDLAKMISAGQHPTVRDVVEIVAQIAGALDAAHARGLVHRDIKPANILVNRPEGRWHAYLTDFGVTKDLADSGLTASGVAVGTLSYISPEQIEGHRIDGRADVYSLACTLFHAVTGQTPFRRESMAALMFAHMHTPAPLLPGPLGAVIARAMAKRPEDRYATAGEFGRAVLAAVPQAAEMPVGPDGRVPFTEFPTPPPGDLPSGPRTPGPPHVSPWAGVPTVLTPAPPDPSRLRRGGFWPAMITGCAVVTALVVAAVVLLPQMSVTTTTGTPGPGPDPVPTTWSPPPTNVAGEVVGATFTTGAAPRDIVRGEKWIWTANQSGGSLSRIDPSTGESLEIPVGGQPNRVFFGAGKAWTWNYSRSITPVVAHTAQAQSHIEARCEFSDLAADDRSIWVVCPDDGLVARFDMERESYLDYIPVGGRPSAVAVLNGIVNVVDAQNQVLLTVDAYARAVTGVRIPLPSGVNGVAAEAGALYVAGPGGVARQGDTPVPAESLIPFEDIAGPGGRFPIMVMTADSAWVCSDSSDEIRRVALDDFRRQVAAPVTGVGRGCGGMLFADDSLWFVNAVTNTVVRIAPAAL